MRSVLHLVRCRAEVGCECSWDGSEKILSVGKSEIRSATTRSRDLPSVLSRCEIRMFSKFGYRDYGGCLPLRREEALLQARVLNSVDKGRWRLEGAWKWSYGCRQVIGSSDVEYNYFWVTFTMSTRYFVFVTEYFTFTACTILYDSDIPVSYLKLPQRILSNACFQSKIHIVVFNFSVF